MLKRSFKTYNSKNKHTTKLFVWNDKLSYQKLSVNVSNSSLIVTVPVNESGTMIGNEYNDAVS